MAALKHHSKVYYDLHEKGHSNVDVAVALEVDEATVRRHLRKLKGSTLSAVLTGRPEAVLDGFMDKPIHVSTEEGGWAITADWHVPLVDYEYVAQFLDHAAELGVRNLIIAGDWLHMDGLSSFDSKQSSAALEIELPESSRLMRLVAERFDTIKYCYGNHDARLQKSLGYQLAFKDAMRLAFGDVGEDVLGKIEFSNLDHILVNTPARTWRVCHPKAYNQQPLTTAIKLETIYRQAIITAHSHHAAMGYAKDGVTPVAEIGGLFDRGRTEYLQRTTTHPPWSQGYGLIDTDGRLVVESPGWSNRL